MTVWTWIAWAASTPALSAAHANVEWSAAVTGSGFTSRLRWRVERSSGTSLLFKLAKVKGITAWTSELSCRVHHLGHLHLFYDVTDVYQIFFKAPACGRTISITTQEDIIMEVHFVAVS